MNQQELDILTRIAVALEAMVQASAPAAPNYQFPFEEYPTFDWQRINATIIASDEYGATAVNWNGHTWKRRNWPQKYGLVIGFTRADGIGEEGVNWLNLISFKEMTAVEPLDEKAAKALVGQRKPTAVNGNGRKPKAEPGTWDHVEEGAATNGHEYEVNTAVMVIGKNDEKPGTIAALAFAADGRPLYIVTVDGKKFKLGSEKFRVVG